MGPWDFPGIVLVVTAAFADDLFLTPIVAGITLGFPLTGFALRLLLAFAPGSTLSFSKALSRGYDMEKVAVSGC